MLRSRQGDYQLVESVTVIGRSRRCDIVLTDPNVSRQHAEIRRQGDGFMLLDLGSTNGTRVNRRGVRQAVLQHGDRIELGTTAVSYTHLRAHETVLDLVCRLLLEKTKKTSDKP